jgi:superfamily II RNA helicase
MLVDGERAWRESDPRWTEKLKQWEAWKLNSKGRERDAQRASRQKKDDTREVQSSSWQSTFDPDEPAPEFSFANTKCGYSQEELRKDMNSLRWHKTSEHLILALERGIAVHHASLPRIYRSLVERYVTGACL